MRRYLHINLDDRSVDAQQLDGEAIVRGGRYLITKTLLERWHRDCRPAVCG